MITCVLLSSTWVGWIEKLNELHVASKRLFENKPAKTKATATTDVATLKQRGLAVLLSHNLATFSSKLSRLEGGRFDRSRLGLFSGGYPSIRGFFRSLIGNLNKRT